MNNQRKPNIIVITADQLRPYELGCYGGKVIQTPNIDRLAKQGAVWETAITNFPVCMAARSVLISGQYNRTATGGKTNVAYPGRPGDFNMPEYPYPRRPHLPNQTLPERLKQAGYQTQTIGKWHIHSWPDDVGFDNYLIPRVHHAHSAQVFSRNGGPEFVPEGFSVDFEAAEAQKYIHENKDNDQPFFLYYNISPPHCPVADMPKKYLNLYQPDEIILRENTDESRIENKDYWYKVYRWDFRYYSLQLPHTQTLPEGYNLQHLAAEYFGAVTWMDSAVGKVLDAVEQAGLQDDTIIIFTADHGENLGSHGLVQKGTENDESIRIPFVMAGPGVKSNHLIQDSVASLLDITPTLLNMIDESVPEHFHGQSLHFEAQGGADSGKLAFFETTQGFGLRSPQMTVYAKVDETGQMDESPSTVYHNIDDPFQYTNLTEQGQSSLLFQALQQRNSTIPWSKLDDHNL